MGGHTFDVSLRVDIAEHMPAWTPEKLDREIRGQLDRKFSATSVSNVEITTPAADDTPALPDGGAPVPESDSAAGAVRVTYTNVNGKERHARSRVAYISDHWVHLPDRDLLLPIHRVVAIDPSNGAVRDLWLPLDGPNPDDNDEQVAEYYDDKSADADSDGGEQ